MSLMTWLDDNDYGYGLGLLCIMGFGTALAFQGLGLAALLFVMAWVLCWWFG